jgi:hypothetical protein
MLFKKGSLNSNCEIVLSTLTLSFWKLELHLNLLWFTEQNFIAQRIQRLLDLVGGRTVSVEKGAVGASVSQPPSSAGWGFPRVTHAPWIVWAPSSRCLAKTERAGRKREEDHTWPLQAQIKFCRDGSPLQKMWTNRVLFNVSRKKITCFLPLASVCTCLILF